MRGIFTYGKGRPFKLPVIQDATADRSQRRAEWFALSNGRPRRVVEPCEMGRGRACSATRKICKFFELKHLPEKSRCQRFEEEISNRKRLSVCFTRERVSRNRKTMTVINVRKLVRPGDLFRKCVTDQKQCVWYQPGRINTENCHMATATCGWFGDDLPGKHHRLEQCYEDAYAGTIDLPDEVIEDADGLLYGVERASVLRLRRS